MEDITLPRDAEGRKIPLDTRKIFDEKGNEWHVMRVEYNPRAHEWRFCCFERRVVRIPLRGIRASRKANSARQLGEAAR